ncbi:hypothetical protein FB472_0231 [Rhodoglobus vestalii]|uniref:Uncharacterized protein n=1 Tax=Rhodoglobus vestalii TaxID=193384 RepID=A0A8H2K3Y7_9MICO|nr:hypothetical protein [Rhodoglobus vestalii]TQO18710.1 hypothetical protein FB472_0231 [Rhodoglobus vestalii]
MSLNRYNATARCVAAQRVSVEASVLPWIRCFAWLSPTKTRIGLPAAGDAVIEAVVWCSYTLAFYSSEQVFFG